jgi:hypothetical protein
MDRGYSKHDTMDRCYCSRHDTMDRGYCSRHDTMDRGYCSRHDTMDRGYSVSKHDTIMVPQNLRTTVKPLKFGSTSFLMYRLVSAEYFLSLNENLMIRVPFPVGSDKYRNILIVSNACRKQYNFPQDVRSSRQWLWRRRHIPPKRRLISSGLYGVIS